MNQERNQLRPTLAKKHSLQSGTEKSLIAKDLRYGHPIFEESKKKRDMKHLRKEDQDQMLLR
jgi:hypothetical protein